VDTSTTFTTTETELTFNTVQRSVGSSASLNGSGRLSLDVEGDFMIIVDMSYDRTNLTPNARSSVRTRLSDDAGSTFLAFSSAYSYHRNNASGEDSVTIHYYYQVTSPPTAISVFGLRLSGDGVIGPISDGCRISAKAL
jgi:hypothetical protein